MHAHEEVKTGPFGEKSFRRSVNTLGDSCRRSCECPCSALAPRTVREVPLPLILLEAVSHERVQKLQGVRLCVSVYPPGYRPAFSK